MTGEFAYSSDLNAAGMLWGAHVRSPHAHARIVGDRHLRARSRMPGVHAVLTHADVPGRNPTGSSSPTSRCSRTTACATRASRSRSSPPSTRSRRAARPRRSSSSTSRSSRSSTRSERPSAAAAPGPADDGARLPRGDRPNVVRHVVIRHGDPDAQGDVTVSGVYELGIRTRRSSGPESGLAVPDGEGGIDIYVATQWLHVDRDQVAPCLGLDASRCASIWRASAARSAAGRTSRCRSTARCSRCTRTAR